MTELRVLPWRPGVGPTFQAAAWAALRSIAAETVSGRVGHCPSTYAVIAAVPRKGPDLRRWEWYVAEGVAAPDDALPPVVLEESGRAWTCAGARRAAYRHVDSFYRDTAAMRAARYGGLPARAAAVVRTMRALGYGCFVGAVACIFLLPFNRAPLASALLIVGIPAGAWAAILLCSGADVLAARTRGARR